MMALPADQGAVDVDMVVSMVSGGSNPKVGSGTMVGSTSPASMDLMKEWEPWRRYIFDAMALVNMQDLSGTVPDVIGHWLVEVLKAQDPAMAAPSYAMFPGNPRLHQIE